MVQKTVAMHRVMLFNLMGKSHSGSTDAFDTQDWKKPLALLNRYGSIQWD